MFFGLNLDMSHVVQPQQDWIGRDLKLELHMALVNSVKRLILPRGKWSILYSGSPLVVVLQLNAVVLV